MTDFTAARINMVDSQIHTMGVVNEAVLNAFRTVRREDFVPDDRRSIAYSDEDLPLSGGRWLMEPVTHARLMQAASPVPGDTVLDIAGGSGYSAAILSGLVKSVVALESDQTLLSRAKDNWTSLSCPNVTGEQGHLISGFEAGGPYSLIVVNGSVAEMPQPWLDQLAPEGRLLAVVRHDGERIGRAMIFTKTSTGGISERILFDASVPYLPGFGPRIRFVF